MPPSGDRTPSPREGNASSLSARERQRFVWRAPALVVVIGLAVAALIGWLGVAQLRARSDEAAALRSQVLSRTLAERLRATAAEDRSAVVERAAQRSGAEILLVDQSGEVAVDGSLGAPVRSDLVSLLVRGEGEWLTQLGRSRFHATPLKWPLEHLSLVVFVHAPERPFATGSLLVSVASLALVMVGAAALVAFALARSANADVLYVRNRIVRMASEGQSPTGTEIPLRDADQVGLLTTAFNVLVERFTAAEHAYRQDLQGALESDKDRSEFLAALSHELRTPLNAILGFSDVLLSEVDGPLTDDARENLTVLRGSAQHLRSLIDDILDLSAMESGELTLDLTEVDIHAIALEIAREARVTAQSKPLVVRVVGEPARAWADARRVRQIIGNVVSNAVKFTQEGSVTVEVTHSGEFVATSITDTGPGIARDQQAAIFEEYRQVDVIKDSRSGVGLGLAITRRLVRMHEGTIELESELGKGSRFTIYLPTHPRGPMKGKFISAAPPPGVVETAQGAEE